MSNPTPTGIGGRVRAGASRSQIAAAIMCWLTVTIEGFDLVTLGAVIPTLLQSKHLGMNPGAATMIATWSLVGVGLGASLVGPLADRLGRRLAIVMSVVLFSIFTIVQPFSSSIAMFTALRFIAGIGLGACMPAALTIMSEVTPAAHRAKATTMTMTGYHVGAVAASLFALAVLPHWQTLFYAGGGVGLVLAVLMWFGLPESRPQHADAHKVPLSTLLKPPFLRASIGVWIGSFMGLLLVYGLLTWLPQIMKIAGYSISRSLVMLFVMNIGAVAGLLLAGWVADTKGIKPSNVAWFAGGAVFLALLSIKMTSEFMVNAVVFIAGVFVFSAMVLIYALVAHIYPSAIRGTALGLTSGIGRLGSIVGPMITGTLVGAGLAYPWGFYFFALVAVLGLAAIAIVPAHAPSRPDGTPDPGGRPYPVDEEHPEAF